MVWRWPGYNAPVAKAAAFYAPSEESGLFIGPVFTREVVTAPRRPRLYISRAAYVSALLVLVCTAWLLLTGTQIVRNVSDMARFGAILFQILAPLQLALAIFFSALLAASAVAQEKDRRTLVLLLLTNLTNSELVLGKLLASLLNVLVLLAAGLPLFMLSALFGGVSFEQIARVFAVTLATVIAAGSLGSTLALAREKTFQTLALTVLALVFWLAAGEAVARGALGSSWAGVSTEILAASLSPWQAILAATRPLVDRGDTLPYLGNAVNGFLLVAGAMAVVLNGVAIGCVRVWNPSREVRSRTAQVEDAESIWGLSERPAAETQKPAPRNVHSAGGKTRTVWDNPILWREIATWAYGRKMLAIRVGYLVLVGLAVAALHVAIRGQAGLDLTTGALVLVPLFVMSLVLVNAQAVTAVTSERDLRALDLLLVTDLSPKEFVFGKLGGIFYNTKEMVVLPMLLCGYLWFEGVLSTENLLYLVGGLAVMDLFAAMLGIHAGMTYGNSRTAIGVSLGTVFFLFVGIATCMRMMIAFSGSFHWQIQPFLAFMLGGGVGLYAALGSRNPSLAIGIASVLAPIATFWAITSFLLQYTLSVFLVTVATYGFATAAMLVPAIFEFDVATGRTAGGDE
jgi:ABC-type transport system involved in multi-copper enzyme maturation permease subunit